MTISVVVGTALVALILGASVIFHRAQRSRMTPQEREDEDRELQTW